MNTESTQSTQTLNLAAEIETVLRLWAQAQAPDRDFSDYRVGVITRPLQHREGVFFAPGELALFRPAAVVAPEGVTVTRPASVWSFDLKRDVLVPTPFLAPERQAAPAPVAEAEEADDDVLNPAA